MTFQRQTKQIHYAGYLFCLRLRRRREYLFLNTKTYLMIYITKTGFSILFCSNINRTVKKFMITSMATKHLMFNFIKSNIYKVLLNHIKHVINTNRQTSYTVPNILPKCVGYSVINNTRHVRKLNTVARSRNAYTSSAILTAQYCRIQKAFSCPRKQ